MLDNITKKNIDDCRDVLVGKVPDPKSQIEQITLALIYKFMDDMDKEAVEKFKGKAKFFSGEYSKYGWRKLFDPSLSGQDMLALYSEALEKLNTNPNIPELFRNIFKNAYLPYRDPSTLKLFLKYINEFEYSHSEKLGDAFEYLLSVMGSQGDAGQFRTPRHIIDFVTACVNPQKNETVLDPACGTAGFLLSAYKHILNQNTDKRQGDKLKPDDRKKLATNFVGYDISPDMVRLSLANMYLHGFATPLIHEYDSLSSEDRWQETFDVILANPPFMTPKGGIRPHKKFGVQANKAEVLFTDYIAEHLNSNGRAGIVVPNGIVATSQTAYKQLRKMLVQDSLIAVISLPAGVFQPYSGVKTSVLILDKRLAKKSQHILFLKIENDGFDLGAQRREIDKNDLPVALQTLEAYKECLSNDVVFKDFPSLATLVEKSVILENRDTILSAERYFEEKIIISEFEKVRLGDITEVITKGTTPTSVGFNFQERGINFIKIESITPEGFIIPEKFAFINEECHKSLKRSSLNENDVLFSIAGALGRVTVINKKYLPANTNQALSIIRLKEGHNPFYVASILRSHIVTDKIENLKTGVAQFNLSLEQIKDFEIPLPPLEIQEQIVTEIQGYQKIIDGAKQVVNNYKPTITINPDWEMVELGTLATFVQGINTAIDKLNYVEDGIKVLQANNIYLGQINFDNLKYITREEFETINPKYKPSIDDVLYSNIGARFGYASNVDFNDEFTYSWNVLRLIINDKEKVNKNYLKVILNQESIRQEVIRKNASSTMPFISGKELKLIQIPIPTISEQQTIVKAIEEELQLVNANKRLIKIFEQKIKTKIGEVWGVETITN
jgi:type I restriction enzyme M protein